MADLTVENGEEAVRLYSKPESISTFQVTEGRLPEADEEIALADFWKDRYQIGQTITFTKKRRKVHRKIPNFYNYWICSVG